MNTISTWKRVPGKCALVFGLGTFLSIMTNPALAGCGVDKVPKPPAERITPGQVDTGLIRTDYRPGSGQFIRADYDTNSPNGAIVGLWSFTLISDGVAPNPVPAGATVDFGTQQWHSDGTELLISGARAPSTGDVCMGVWQQIRPFTYKLKHLALGWVSPDTPPSMGGPGPSPAQFLGPGIITENVTLDKSRNKFEGKFTLDQYNADGSKLLTHISGTVTATRVTVD